jgi:hypothetical protein
MLRRLRRTRGPVEFRRGGRNAVVTMLVFWAASQFALGRAMDASLWLRDPLYADKYAKLRQRIAARTTAAGRPFAVAFVGSSRTSYGVRGDVVEAAVRERTGRTIAATNLGVPASGPVANLLTVGRLSTATDRPDLVIIEVMPPLLAEVNHLAAEHPHLVPERFQRAEVAAAVRFGLPADATWSRWWSAELVPAYGLRFPVLGRVANFWLPWYLRNSSRDTDPVGWQPSMHASVTAAEYRAGVEQARKEYYALLQVLRFDSPAAAAVRETVAACRRRPVNAAILLMPEGTDFRSWYPPDVDAGLYAFLDTICRESGARLIDARRWLPDSMFSDTHHLLRSGAAEFSRRLGEAIAPLIASAGDRNR